MRPRNDDREPQQESTREPLVDLNVKPPQPGAPSAGTMLRRKRLSDKEPEGNPAPPQKEPAREALVDLNVKPPQSDALSTGLKLRRKRSSDRELDGNAAPPQPQIGRQHRRLLAPSDTGSAEPTSEREPSPGFRRPRLVTIMAAPEAATPQEATPPGEATPEGQEPRPQMGRTRVAITPAPEEAVPQEVVSEGATPEGQEPRPKMGHARVTITQAPEDPAGLQNIIDPPRSLTAVLAPGRGEIEVTVADRPVKQGFSAALVGGVTAALAAALVWALITMATGYHAGWMAVGTGLLIGGAIRTISRGEDKSFGYVGAIVAVLGCLVGNLLSVCAMVAGQESLSPLNVLTYICTKPARIPGAMLAAFQFLDLLFWAVGIYAAYRLSFRRIPPAETADGDSGK